VSLLLDSHAVLWFLLGDGDRFPAAVRDRIEDPGERVVVSVASQWELMLKAGTGKLSLPDAPERFLFDVVDEAGFRLLHVQPRHAQALAELPQLHADPFDRMLVAQALVEDLTLVTGDEVLHRYPVATLW
jgi:PIN domain nuclease of toxin-antitoxin system